MGSRKNLSADIKRIRSSKAGQCIHITQRREPHISGPESSGYPTPQPQTHRFMALPPMHERRKGGRRGGWEEKGRREEKRRGEGRKEKKKEAAAVVSAQCISW